MDESLYKTPKQYKSGILLTCPPAPRARKTSITFDRAHLIIPSSDTDNDDDSKNSIDLSKLKRRHVHRRPSNIPFFFPMSSSILDSKIIEDEDLSHFYGMINSRPEASFTLKKRRRLNPEVSSKTTRVSIEQFPMLPFPTLRGDVVPPSSTPSSSATPTRPGIKIKPSTPSSSTITMPRSSSDPNTLKKSTERRTSIPHVPQRRRSSIARCA